MTAVTTAGHLTLQHPLLVVHRRNSRTYGTKPDGKHTSGASRFAAPQMQFVWVSLGNDERGEKNSQEQWQFSASSSVVFLCRRGGNPRFSLWDEDGVIFSGNEECISFILSLHIATEKFPSRSRESFAIWLFPLVKCSGKMAHQDRSCENAGNQTIAVLFEGFPAYFIEIKKFLY